jgi:hypothetical protein
MRRWCAAGIVVIGFLVALNAIVSGPHAFGGGASAVVAMVLAGIVQMACGYWMIRESSKKTEL